MTYFDTIIAAARRIKWAMLSLLRKDSVRWKCRPVLDITTGIGGTGSLAVTYTVDLDKEAISREYIFNIVPAKSPGQRLRFLDVGGNDGSFTYLFGGTAPLSFDPTISAKNKAAFASLYDYFGVDLRPSGPHVLHGDMCDRAFAQTYLQQAGTFDVIYSNNVLEHFERAWIAVENMLSLLRPGGIIITIVPFAQRYHEAPGDHFRYTHTGVTKLFEAAGSIKVLEAGYDIRARRYDWQAMV